VILRDLLQRDTMDLASVLALVHLLTEKQWSAEAEALLLRAHQEYPTSATALLALSRLARQQGNAIASLRYLAIASEINEPDLTTRLELAAEYAVHGRFEEALGFIQSVIAIDPDNWSAWSQLGRYYRSAGNAQQAKSAFEVARKLNPSKIETLVDLAQASMAAGLLQDADTFLKQALAQEPTHFGALVTSAEHALFAEDTERAADFAHRAKTLHPNQLGAYLLSARIAAESLNYDEAFALLAEALRIFGTQPAIQATQIFFLRQQRQHTTARLVAAAAFNEKMPIGLWSECAALANTLGDFAQSEKLIANSIAGTAAERAKQQFFRAQLAEAKRDYRSAIDGYGAALALNPTVGGWHSELARCHLLLAETDAAQRHLKTSMALDAGLRKAKGQSVNLSQHHIGQILDEFQLDRQALSDLQAIAGLPAFQQVEPLKQLVRKNPDQTAPALLLMLAMRQSGLFDRERHAATSTIPKRLIQYWDAETPPADLSELMKSWQVQNPQYDYALFDDASVRSFLQERSSARVVDAFRRAQHPAQRADIFRLAYLANEGGFYVDADDRCLGNIGLLYPDAISLALYQENYGTIGNNLIGASAGHAVVLRALDLATEAVLRGDNDIVWLSTGPALLTRAFAQIFAESEASLFLQSTMVRELGETQRLVGMHCPANYKRTDKHWSRAAFSNKELAAKK
jgi:mannosyltransferase OCH1-like enzyme/Tfp pilus assembly protein PilF